ncbi:MAG: Crp/Fnr family transcriptional regulator [Anaerolineaceae bacterium]|nr:Crp/Fnr family transcriptional regulator [Anaerolineaceae bacterium]
MSKNSTDREKLRKRFQKSLLKLGIFDLLPKVIYEELFGIAALRHFNVGQVIYLEGERADFVYILEKGWVKSSQITRKGREQGLLFLKPVEIFGDIAVFTETSYPGTTTALEAVEVWVIPSDKFLEIVNRCPGLALAIIRKLSFRVLHFISLVDDLSLKSVESRLASTLLQYAESHNGQLIVQRRTWTTLDEMAIRFGTVRNVLSRAMIKLESEGYIKVEKQSIILLNPDDLAERADN